MLTEPLPSTLDIRKAAARGVSISGAVKAVDLPRFLPLLAAETATIDAFLDCSRDEENRYLVRIVVEASVTVACQRCLEAMSVPLRSENTLAVVWTDEQAAHLPRHLDPLILSEEPCNLWELVADELILAMPAYSYHDTDECNRTTAGFVDPETDSPEEKPNPFNVLEQLKPGNKH